MCGGCKVGPEIWQCRQCGATNSVRFTIKCSRCGHSLIGQMNIPILKSNPQPPQGG
jgi:hypothetical protein